MDQDQWEFQQREAAREKKAAQDLQDYQDIQDANPQLAAASYLFCMVHGASDGYFVPCPMSLRIPKVFSRKKSETATKFKHLKNLSYGLCCQYIENFCDLSSISTQIQNPAVAGKLIGRVKGLQSLLKRDLEDNGLRFSNPNFSREAAMGLRDFREHGWPPDLFGASGMLSEVYDENQVIGILVFAVTDKTGRNIFFVISKRMRTFRFFDPFIGELTFDMKKNDMEQKEKIQQAGALGRGVVTASHPFGYGLVDYYKEVLPERKDRVFTMAMNRFMSYIIRNYGVKGKPVALNTTIMKVPDETNARIWGADSAFTGEMWV